MLQGAFLSVLFAGIARLFLTSARYLTPRIVTWVLLSLGIGFVTYQGMDLLVDYLVSEIMERFGDLPTDVAEILQYMGVIKAINIISSGLVAGITMRFGVAASVRKFKFYA